MAIKINGNTVIADNQAFTTTSTISATGNITGGNLSVIGTVTAAGINTGSSPISTTGNVVGGNILTGGVVSAAGNVTGNFILGNGSQLTGIDATSIQSGTSNVRVVSSGGNVAVGIGGTANVVVVATSGQFVTGVNSVSGNIDGGNIRTAGLISAAGNITSGNINTNNINMVASGSTINVGGVGGTIKVGNPFSANGLIYVYSSAGFPDIVLDGSNSSIDADGNITGGNLVTAGAISATGAITGGDISAVANISGLNITTTGPSANIGTATDNSTYNFGTGTTGSGRTKNINVGTNGAAGSNTVITVGTAGGNANATFTANTIVSIANTSGSALSVAGNVTAGNVTTSGRLLVNVIASSSAVELTNGAISASGNVTGGNLLTAGILSATGNVFGGNALFSGNLTVNGNVTYINSNVVTINDLAINLANNAANVAQTNGGGIELGPQGSPYVTFLYNSSANTWVSSAGLSAAGNVIGGNIRTAGLITATGTVTAGNVITAGFIEGSDIYSSGSISATGNIACFGNVSGLGVLAGSTGVSATGNITGGNLSVGTGRVTVGNIVNSNANGVGNIGSTGNRFNQVFALASSAQYADLAEKYTADADYAAGTVLVFGGSAEVTADAVDSDPRVAGVVSTNPAYIMNDGLSAEFVAAVALTGRVPCLVTGSVRKGDLMVTAGNGAARAAADPRVGTVIGKALENHDGESGTIEVVVGRF